VCAKPQLLVHPPGVAIGQALGNAPDAHEIVEVLHLIMAADLPNGAFQKSDPPTSAKDVGYQREGRQVGSPWLGTRTQDGHR
jgi:hypothetical protein